MAEDEDYGELADEFENAGAAARMFEDSLGSLTPALLNNRAAAVQAGQAARDAQGRFIAAGDGASKAGGSMGGLAGAIASVGAAAMAIATGALPSATQAGQALGQAIGGALTDGASKASEALSALGPEGEAAGEALQVVAGVAAATIGTLSTLAGIAIDVTQNLGLMRDRFAALAGSAAGGAAVTAMVERLSTSLPFATAQIESWARSLEAAGLTGQRLENSIKAVAAASALMGDQGGAAAQNLLKKLAEGGEGAKKLVDQLQKGGGRSNKLLADMGLSTKDLAAAMGMTAEQFAKASLNADQMNDAITKALAKKGAGPLDDLSNTLPNILQKAREGFLSLFADLGPAVKPFMSAVKSLFGEFSKGGVAINAIKPIVTAVFGTLFSWATTAVNAIHKGFLLIAIGALRVYIALKPIIDKIKELAKSQTAITGFKIVLAALALPFIAIAAAVGIVIAAVGVLIGVFVGLVAAAAYVVGFVGEVLGALGELAAGAASAASNFIAGLVQGIVAGAGAVVSAVANLAKSALGAFTGALGIKSPSTIMLEHGEDNIAGAAATGIDKGSAKVDDAMARMGSGEPGEPKRSAKSSSGGGASSSSGPVFNNCVFNGTTEADMREVWRIILDETAGEAPAS